MPTFITETIVEQIKYSLRNGRSIVVAFGGDHSNRGGGHYNLLQQILSTMAQDPKCKRLLEKTVIFKEGASVNVSDKFASEEVRTRKDYYLYKRAERNIIKSWTRPHAEEWIKQYAVDNDKRNKNTKQNLQKIYSLAKCYTEISSHQPDIYGSGLYSTSQYQHELSRHQQRITETIEYLLRTHNITGGDFDLFKELFNTIVREYVDHYADAPLYHKNKNLPGYQNLNKNKNSSSKNKIGDSIFFRSRLYSFCDKINVPVIDAERGTYAGDVLKNLDKDKIETIISHLKQYINDRSNDFSYENLQYNKLRHNTAKKCGDMQQSLQNTITKLDTFIDMGMRNHQYKDQILLRGLVCNYMVAENVTNFLETVRADKNPLIVFIPFGQSHFIGSTYKKSEHIWSYSSTKYSTLSILDWLNHFMHTKDQLPKFNILTYATTKNQSDFDAIQQQKLRKDCSEATILRDKTIKKISKLKQSSEQYKVQSQPPEINVSGGYVHIPTPVSDMIDVTQYWLKNISIVKPYSGAISKFYEVHIPYRNSWPLTINEVPNNYILSRVEEILKEKEKANVFPDPRLEQSLNYINYFAKDCFKAIDSGTTNFINRPDDKRDKNALKKANNEDKKAKTISNFIALNQQRDFSRIESIKCPSIEDKQTFFNLFNKIMCDKKSKWRLYIYKAFLDTKEKYSDMSLNAISKDKTLLEVLSGVFGDFKQAMPKIL